MASPLVEYQCPRCGRRIDEATEARGEEVRPLPGDLALCIGCAAPLQFRVAMPPRWLTYEEVRDLPKEQRAQLVQAIIVILTVRPSTLSR